MAHSPYREPFKLDTALQVTVEKEVADLLKAMSDKTKIPVDEMVNTAMRRYIATHSDYIPSELKKRSATRRTDR